MGTTVPVQESEPLEPGSASELVHVPDGIDYPANNCVTSSNRPRMTASKSLLGSSDVHGKGAAVSAPDFETS